MVPVWVVPSPLSVFGFWFLKTTFQMREMKLLKTLPQQPADMGQENNLQLRPQRKSPPCHVPRPGEVGEALVHCLARPSHQGEGPGWRGCAVCGQEWRTQGRVGNTTCESEVTKILGLGELPVSEGDPATPLLGTMDCTLLPQTHLQEGSWSPFLPLSPLHTLPRLGCVSLPSFCCRSLHPQVLNSIWLSSEKPVGGERRSQSSFDLFGRLRSSTSDKLL